MATEVDVWVWPQLMLARGAEVTFRHWVTGADGISKIDPDHWYWMSAVPDYDPDQLPDGPASATGIQIVEQYAYRPYEDPAGGNNAVWMATWRTPTGLEEGDTWFRPRMIVAPGS
ncbi:MAG: hypothetical protein WAL04_13035 [Acidimicrobiales bacterium]|jgi:hypothetical protein